MPRGPTSRRGGPDEDDETARFNGRRAQGQPCVVAEDTAVAVPAVAACHNPGDGALDHRARLAIGLLVLGGLGWRRAAASSTS